MQSRGYSGVEYLKREDTDPEIRCETDKYEHLEVSITLKYEKGYKNDVGHQTVKYLHPRLERLPLALTLEKQLEQSSFLYKPVHHSIMSTSSCAETPPGTIEDRS